MKTAVITGATSGIGAAFAEILAARGYDLLLCGRREEKISNIASRLRLQHEGEVRVILAELSVESEVDRLVAEVRALPEVSMLINNAGFGAAGRFSENPSQHHRMLAVHVIAATRLIEAVLPSMKRRRSGSIINVSSVAAYFPMPTGATYAATKRYLNVFSESLHMELKPYGIRVQALCPGMTRTDFHSRSDEGRSIAKKNVLGWMEPSTVARRSLKRVSGRGVIYVPGLINKFLVRFLSCLPRRPYYWIVGKVLSIERFDYPRHHFPKKSRPEGGFSG